MERSNQKLWLESTLQTDRCTGSPECTGEQLWLCTARRVWGSEQEAEDFAIAQPVEDVCIPAVPLKPADLHLKKATLMQKHLEGTFLF